MLSFFSFPICNIKRTQIVSQTISLCHHLNDLKDLFASGDTIPPIPKALSRDLLPVMLAVFAQNPQMYTLGMERLVIFMHLP